MIIPQTHGAEQLDMGAEMFGQDGQDGLDTSDQMKPFCTVQEKSLTVTLITMTQYRAIWLK